MACGTGLKLHLGVCLEGQMHAAWFGAGVGTGGGSGDPQPAGSGDPQPARPAERTQRSKGWGTRLAFVRGCT